MHEIAPFHRWTKHYRSENDPQSPFYGKSYNFESYSETIYGYYIDPDWDYIGSETLYIKILYTDYDTGFTIIELFGEWNDAIHNDIMHLKRNIVEHLISEGIEKFILITENILNFHGSDDAYYEEWFEELDEGWVVALNSRDFVQQEWKHYGLDYYINFGGTLDIQNWRTLSPRLLFDQIEKIIRNRLSY
ncbi:MAG: hypothetical protein LAT68_01350 [Cyclobacteriaceae bacterium]|nr:hypothetical protein [Cyclobacteriaceae bacterium]MCH8514949.1 hypothetical protein [Cyclobacteriaceae bacterium]